MPPAGFEEFQIQNRFENEKSGKVATGHFAFRNSGFPIGVAFEGTPKLAGAIYGRRCTENEYAIGAILLEAFEVLGCKVSIQPRQQATRDKHGVRSADG